MHENHHTNTTNHQPRHRTKKAADNVRRCAVEVSDNSLAGFNIIPGDRAIVILDKEWKFGMLSMVHVYGIGILLRVIEPCGCGSFDALLASGHKDYGVYGIQKKDFEVLGYVTYLERKCDDGSWRQFAVDERLTQQVDAVHGLSEIMNHRKKSSNHHHRMP